MVSCPSMCWGSIRRTVVPGHRASHPSISLATIIQGTPMHGTFRHPALPNVRMTCFAFFFFSSLAEFPIFFSFLLLHTTHTGKKLCLTTEGRIVSRLGLSQPNNLSANAVRQCEWPNRGCVGRDRAGDVEPSQLEPSPEAKMSNDTLVYPMQCGEVRHNTAIRGENVVLSVGLPVQLRTSLEFADRGRVRGEQLREEGWLGRLRPGVAGGQLSGKSRQAQCDEVCRPRQQASGLKVQKQKHRRLQKKGGDMRTIYQHHLLHFQ
ncbi:hypothetical protein B0H66DRAFT_306851 [Apodospora peruviana]|uniref:Uncharacterized protein n=1 Tax=Apodospora peruviana TaxID=516989 RepID=A0AAE0I1H4_9PEZI|nr:hypothetical protein B0H66DRAFT_306851 [Apodospora peruviana]